MECVLCGVDDIAEPIVFVHFLLFDLMGESFPGSPIKENRLQVSVPRDFRSKFFSGENRRKCDYALLLEQ